MIKKGANRWDWGFLAACQRGHLKLANLMIKKGANDWNSGLSSACQGGYLELASLMIEKGATDWNRGFSGACYGGQLKLANLMIEKGANDFNQITFNFQIKLLLQINRTLVDPRTFPMKRFLRAYIRRKRNTLQWQCALRCLQLYSSDFLVQYPPFMFNYMGLKEGLKN